MGKPIRKRSASRGGRKEPTPDQVKIKLLTRKNPSAASGISDAPVIKDGDVFLVTEKDGLIPFSGNHGFGLYYHDCRYLDGYRITINGAAMDSLSLTTRDGFLSAFELTNPSLPYKRASSKKPAQQRTRGSSGNRARKEDRIHEHSLGLRLTHLLSRGEASMRDILEVRNFGPEAIELEVRIELRSRFDDVFNIRGLDDRKPGKVSRPAWSGQVLAFAYRGGDGIERSLSVRFQDSLRKGKGAEARFAVRLKPEKTQRLEWVFLIHEDGEHGADTLVRADAIPNAKETHRLQAEERNEHTSRGAEIACDHELLNLSIGQALKDLRSLQSEYEGLRFFSAGIPWFATLFGRDTLTACLQTLAFDQESSAGTLRLLARMQGRKMNPWTEEQPGRILHEFRRGELARANMIPYSPFYGTVDATALFLILLAEHSLWSGSLDLFRELRASVDLALAWMDRYGDANGDGYLEYAYPRVGSQINLGWKDAGDSIPSGDGSLAKSPISLVEVQAYAYRARIGIAHLLRRNGEAVLAGELEADAAGLRSRFHRDYWMGQKKFFAIALHGRGGQADVVSSNPGQALWGGIVEPARAEAVRDRLMAEDLFTGWGVRTLSSGEKRYNPTSYHLGSVWPHDNSFIAAGLRDYGFDSEAMRLFEGMLDAADHFPERRLPELFCGFSQREFPEPVKYPIACHPQAWAAGTLPYMLTTLLGLRPDGFQRRLAIVRPMLPAGCNWLEWKRLRVRDAKVDLRFERDGERVRVRVLKTEGQLEVAHAPAHHE
ncbi:MAG: amylo-alpha-1,6-glucosidase [Fibrobacteres bacterium]|nr:amylo-alpha-1,6-glucosidase [Fibrobacterota bacterium]